MSNASICNRWFWVVTIAYVVLSVATALIVLTIVWAYLTHTSILLNITWYLALMVIAFALIIYSDVKAREDMCGSMY